MGDQDDLDLILDSRRDTVRTLKSTDAFQNVSLRLLSDFLERVSYLPVDHGRSENETRQLLLVGDPPTAALHDDVVAFEHLFAASPSLTNGLAPELREKHRPAPKDKPLAQAIWICRSKRYRVNLLPLAHLLAAATRRESREPTALVTLGDQATITVWNDRRRGDVIGIDTRRGIADRDILHYLTDDPKQLCHIYYVDPRHPFSPPPEFRTARFHRVVYVTDRQPSAVPHPVRSWLVPHVFPAGNAEPSFSSFVASIMLPKRRAPESYCSATLASLAGSEFKTRPMTTDADEPSGELTAPDSKLARDLCRLRLDVGALDQLWQGWSTRAPEGRPTFLDVATRAHVHVGTSVDRWARAVTNRQVGIGLSGGGASAYRFVPLLRILEGHAGLPVDVVAGVSGGSLIAAYYVQDGQAGLEHAVNEGPSFERFVFLASLSSMSIEVKVDADLGGTLLTELECRFAPVTTELPQGPEAPRGAVVVRGRVGEGVRASGSAIMGFGATHKNGCHYTDGFSATMVPSRILKEYGADLVLSCNCIAGPRYGNPFFGMPFGPTLAQLPLIDRFADAMAAMAEMFEQTSRRAGADSDVFVEFPGESIPLAEMGEWSNAAGIVERALEAKPLLERKAMEMKTLYDQLGRQPT